MNNEYVDNMVQLNREIFSAAEKGESPEEALEDETTTSVDLLQEERDARSRMNKKQFPKGSSKKLRKCAADVAARLRPAYRRAESDSELLKKRGDIQRARMIIGQYMEDKFLPAIEALILLTNVDEVLNSREVLNLLDDYVLMEAGSGSGYTRSYIESLYDDFRGKTQGMSDYEVMKTIGKIHKLIEVDEIRTAISLANRIKDKIDAGENQASDEDYDLIATIVARGQ